MTVIICNVLVLIIIIIRYIQMGVNGSRQIHIKNVEEHYNKC